MRRLAPIGLALATIGLPLLRPAEAPAITKDYSTGSIHARIGARLDRGLRVPDAGPVSFVRVSLRISVPDTSALAISLVSPRGTVVPLVVHRGAGADVGEGAKSCQGLAATFSTDATAPVTTAAAPFTQDDYRPEGSLRSLDGQQARGRWALRIENDGPPAILHCFALELSRAIPQALSAARGAIRASLAFVERAYRYERQRLEVVRAGQVALDEPLARLGCRDCAYSRPLSVRIRDLDGGEPEVLVDRYTGGAHCCSVLLVLRWDAAARRYRWSLLDFGNFGYRLVDLDRDGLPELSAYDERFVYTFAPFAASVAPPRIVQYRQGRLVDVTRRFPAAVRASARESRRLYLSERRRRGDVRSILATYVADEELLGRPDEATRALEVALARGDLGPRPDLAGWPQGRTFVATLMRDLRRWGYDC